MGTLICTSDIGLFNCIAAEVNKLAGMYCYYYRMDKENTTHKAIYDEVSNPVYLDQPDGLRMPAWGDEPAHSTTASEEGRRKQWDGTVWIARINWERIIEDSPDGALLKAGGTKTLGPRIGDVMVAWNDFYDVVDVTRDGILDDERRIFSLYKITIRRNTKHEPWRRTIQP